ncbi:hypothetical protein [Cronbergia sp. UHCC 0137]|uniref:hypothetical protein n=1 Tax=Cronbergia sp. UHCC 0137 TaxID=3110239 RepID=UPI003A4C537F
MHEAINLHWDDVSPAHDGGYRVKIVGKNSKVRYNRINPNLYEEMKLVPTLLTQLIKLYNRNKVSLRNKDADGKN